MKSISRYLSLGLLLSVAITLHEVSYALDSGCAQAMRTTFVPMTVGQNLPMQYHKLLFPDNDDGNWSGLELHDTPIAASLSATYRYMQTRNGSAIGNYLWGTNGLIFQGREIQDRLPDALVAEYFGMGPDTNLRAFVAPQLNNQVLDLQFELSTERVWFQCNIPLVWANWKVNKQSGQPLVEGNLGFKLIDGGDLSLVYNIPNNRTAAGVGTISVNGLQLTNTSSGYVWFDNQGNADPSSSLVGQIASQDALPVMSTDNVSIETRSGVTTNFDVLNPGSVLNLSGGNDNQTVTVGIIPVGLYGPVLTNVEFIDKGVIDLEVNVEELIPVNSVAAALGKGYPCGFFAGRINNNFNFAQCTKFNVADLPMMLGYDFCKSDAYHIGAYVKCVIPTGTKIDEKFIQYVLTPVIGNGRHFELGAGLSAHMNFLVCDESSWGVFFDGYINKMFGAWQTRTFDLIGQPMSRYALLFPVTGNAFTGYSVENNQIVALGDVNVTSRNVDGFRGEFIIDCIYGCQNWEVGVGYAFSGQSQEKLSCGPCGQYDIPALTTDLGINKLITGYGFVGQALQHAIGVLVTPSQSNLNTAAINNNYAPGAATTTKINVNFFDCGTTNQVATIPSGKSSGYSYGEVESVTDSNIYMLDDFLDNASGLMNTQILNRLFGHIDYVWKECSWQPEVGIVGSVGFSPCSKLTAAYWDLGARIGCAF